MIGTLIRSYQFSRLISRLAIPQKLKIPKSQKQLIDLYNNIGNAFQPVHYVSLIRNYSKLPTQEDLHKQDLEGILFKAEEAIKHLNQNQLFTLYVASSRCKHFRALSRKLYSIIKDNINLNQCAITAWSLSKAKIHDPKFFAYVSTTYCEALQKYKGEPKKEIIKRTHQSFQQQQSESDIDEEEFQTNQSQFEPSLREATLILWSERKSLIEDKELSEIVLRLSVEYFDTIELKTVIILIFSTLKLRKYPNIVKEQDLLIKLLSSQIKRLSDESILNLKILLTSLHKLKTNNHSFAITLAEIILKRTRKDKNHLSGKFITQILWSLYHIGVDQDKIYQDYINELEYTFNSLKSIDCSQLFAVFMAIKNDRGISLILKQLPNINIDDRSLQFIIETAKPHPKLTTRLKEIFGKQMQ